MTDRKATTLSAGAALTALCQATALGAADGKVPEWIHLLPRGEFRAVDGRGPFKVEDPARLAADSMKAANGSLPIDETHATDYAAPRGEPAPARGWMVELEARADGVWAKVDWTKAGHTMVAEGEYRHISPVILTDKQNRVTRIVRAALTNNPAVPQLQRFQNEDTMNELLQKLRSALGLSDDADEAAIMAAIGKLKEGGKGEAETMSATLQSIAKAVGLQANAEAKAIVGAIEQLADPTKSPTVAALQKTVNELTTQLTTLQADVSNAKSAAVIDKAIEEQRAGVSQANRDQLIALHAKDPAGIEKWIEGLPSLKGAIIPSAQPKNKDGKVTLSAEQSGVARLLGVPAADMEKTLAAETAVSDAA